MLLECQTVRQSTLTFRPCRAHAHSCLSYCMRQPMEPSFSNRASLTPQTQKKNHRFTNNPSGLEHTHHDICRAQSLRWCVRYVASRARAHTPPLPLVQPLRYGQRNAQAITHSALQALSARGNAATSMLMSERGLQSLWVDGSTHRALLESRRFGRTRTGLRGASVHWQLGRYLCRGGGGD